MVDKEVALAQINIFPMVVKIAFAQFFVAAKIPQEGCSGRGGSKNRLVLIQKEQAIVSATIFRRLVVRRKFLA